MKVIDLYNKIANGEELPNEIEYSRKHYYLTNNNDIDVFGSVIGMFSLNDEITILDEDYLEDTPNEDKKIEELSTWFAISDEPSLEGLCKYIDNNNEQFYNKINELVRKVNGE